MEIMEVPFPALGRGEVMVRNHYSVIIAGTEWKRVLDAWRKVQSSMFNVSGSSTEGEIRSGPRKGYIAKARIRQKEIQLRLLMKNNQKY